MSVAARSTLIESATHRDRGARQRTSFHPARRRRGLSPCLPARPLCGEAGGPGCDGRQGERRRRGGAGGSRVPARAGGGGHGHSRGARTIRRLAREFAAARAACYGRIGTCVNTFGSVTSWLQEVVNVVTGNFDRVGAPCLPAPPSTSAWSAADFGLSPAGIDGVAVCVVSPNSAVSCPPSTMAEEMETAGDGQIRAFVTLAGNPVLSSPNAERLSRALSSLDFMVSIDIYRNETTRHAHVILPPRYALERPHFDVVFPALAVRNFVRWSERGDPSRPRHQGRLGDPVRDGDASGRLALRQRRLRPGRTRVLAGRAATDPRSSGGHAPARRTLPPVARPSEEGASRHRSRTAAAAVGTQGPHGFRKSRTRARRRSSTMRRRVNDWLAAIRERRSGPLADRPPGPAKQQLLAAQRALVGEGFRPDRVVRELGRRGQTRPERR